MRSERTYLQHRKIHRHRENTHGCQGGRVGQEKDWEFGVIRCKLFYAGWKVQKGLQYSTGKYMQYYGET